MKREELKEMGLTDEQIEKIMAETGKDICRIKNRQCAGECLLLRRCVLRDKWC